MKKFNKNSIVFLFVIIFIIVGLWGNCFEQLKLDTLDMLSGIKHGNITSIFDFKTNVDDISNQELSYHHSLMDVNSIKENLIGTRVVNKKDTIVVKADSGSLIEPIKKIKSSEIKQVVNKIATLKNVSENNGASFLYCAVPSKELYEKAPQNIDNCFEENYNLFLSELAKSSVPTLDFAETLSKSNFEVFYKTDHHWTVRAGFEANNALLNKLNQLYGFEYNKEMMDLTNYNIDFFYNCFLGAKGKKVGTYFTWDGADDFQLITPKFMTSFIEEQPFKNQIRTGSFKETVLYMYNMKRDYYNINTYATYSGGDFRLQIMKNNFNTNGKKILLIRDSFACVVAPFLALQLSELHICDIRDGDDYAGNIINIKDYIKEVEPDYVVVIYLGVTSLRNSGGRFNFF